MDFREGIEVCELELVVDMDMAETVSLATEDYNEVISFKLGEGVGAESESMKYSQLHSKLATLIAIASPSQIFQ